MFNDLKSYKIGHTADFILAFSALGVEDQSMDPRHSHLLALK